MKAIFLIAALFTCSLGFAQTITGKWKPVFVRVDSMMTADLKTGTTTLSDKIDEQFKNDKDPKASKDMMLFMAQVMLQRMQDTEEEFIAPGEYIEINKKRNTTAKGSYTLDGQNLVITSARKKVSKFKVSFKNEYMILTAELESEQGKKGEMQVEYERVK